MEQQGSGPGAPPPETGPPGGQQPGADPDQGPATRGQLRTLRRWTAVAGVWAVAATAIGLIALLTGNEEDQKTSSDLDAQISRLERTLDKRIDSLQSQIKDLPTSADLQKLQGRLQHVEDQSAQTSRDAKQTSDQLSDLSRRVDRVEQQQRQQSTTTTPSQGQTTTRGR
jgi:septal ring factor EnvC (AmiA/AmiB activator)